MVAQTAETTRWADLDPTQSASALIAWITVLEAQATNTPLQDSIMNVMRLSVTDLQSRIRSD